jgi:hypothetical protein
VPDCLLRTDLRTQCERKDTLHSFNRAYQSLRFAQIPRGTDQSVRYEMLRRSFWQTFWYPNKLGSIGVSAAVTVLARRVQVHQNTLVSHLTPGSEASMLSYIDAFNILAIGSFLAAPIPLLVRRAELPTAAYNTKEEIEAASAH